MRMIIRVFTIVFLAQLTAYGEHSISAGTKKTIKNAQSPVNPQKRKGLINEVDKFQPFWSNFFEVRHVHPIELNSLQTPYTMFSDTVEYNFDKQRSLGLDILFRKYWVKYDDQLPYRLDDLTTFINFTSWSQAELKLSLVLPTSTESQLASLRFGVTVTPSYKINIEKYLKMNIDTDINYSNYEFESSASGEYNTLGYVLSTAALTWILNPRYAWSNAASIYLGYLYNNAQEQRYILRSSINYRLDGSNHIGFSIKTSDHIVSNRKLFELDLTSISVYWNNALTF